ncbi:EVE domain-containing protein [Blastopirellula sp. JC732]|uniref:EVE domain-containing protein n=1 Tax=Blastopirellula sediminis TaxID=2894196 RepID=A0A9X1MN60_9BACT|nr:EVE domain-containing protein [Blastopirellula sediminis]MCC9607427.1 EVE domain-containing protein [Blastopirellula sediminis]MCC9629280.1 EVE domain-containing protein [Blastopirellula sediminis]
MAKKAAKSNSDKRYWLLKTESESYSIDDLANEKKQTTFWSGVRNYQARNFMRDDMKVGDEAFFYHSNASPPAIVGTATIVKEGYPDHTSWDKKDHHYDEKSTPDAPRWFMVDVQLTEMFEEPLGRDQLTGVAALADMELMRKGSRLSVQPVTKNEWDAVLKLAKRSKKRK